MKKNLYKMAAMTALAGAMMAGFAMPAFATGWQEDERGRWYGTNEDNTTWHRRNWYWIDDNGDNIAERYYFDEDGYLVTNGTEVGWGDEFTNENGAWIKDGIVQTRVADLRTLPLPQVDGASAIGWRQDGAGWRYIPGRDSTAWYRDGWFWIDDNNDNIAECYYFDKNGYRLMSTSAPDGYSVNANGAWNDLVDANGKGIDGGVQQRIVDPAKASNVTYDVHDYDSQGLSKAAMDILAHTRVENKKYGETDQSNSEIVYYANGLCANYGYPSKKDGRPYDVYSENDSTRIFREPISGTKEDVERLKAKGYDARWGFGGLGIEGFWDKRAYITMGGDNYFIYKVRDEAWGNWGTDWGY